MLKLDNLRLHLYIAGKLSLTSILNTTVTPSMMEKSARLYLFPPLYFPFLEQPQGLFAISRILYSYIHTVWTIFFYLTSLAQHSPFEIHTCVKTVNSFFLLSILHHIDVPQPACPFLVIDYDFQLLSITNKISLTLGYKS